MKVKKLMQIRNIIFIILVISIFFGILFFSPFEKSKEKIDNRPHVVASFYPLAHFAEQIAKDNAVVSLIIPDGVEAHHFEPTPADIISIQNAQIFLFQGGNFDFWAQTVASQFLGNGVRGINMIELVKKKQQFLEDDNEKKGSSLNPHIWLDPVLAIKEVEIIRDELKIIDPLKAMLYEENANDYIEALKELDQDFRQGLQNCQLKEIIVSHDAFGNLAERYHFGFTAIMGISSEEEPSLSRLSEVVKNIKEKNIEWFFIEPFDEGGIENTLQNETTARALILHPIETLTSQERKDGKNYLSLMRENLENLKKAMKCSS